MTARASITRLARAAIVSTAMLVAAQGVPVGGQGAAPPFKPHPSTQEPSRLVTLDMLKRWERELSNWGRWGKDDQRGMLNLVTPAKTKAATALVTEGRTVTLSINPIKKTGSDTGTFGENLHRMARVHPVTGAIQGALDVTRRPTALEPLEGGAARARGGRARQNENRPLSTRSHEARAERQAKPPVHHDAEERARLEAEEEVRAVVARFSLRAHREPSTRAGRKYLRLNDGDEAILVDVCKDGDRLACGTVQGHALVTTVDEVPILAGAGKGVKLAPIAPKVEAPGRVAPGRPLWSSLWQTTPTR